MKKRKGCGAWLSGWLAGPWARRITPFRLVGPPGTKELMENLQRAYAADIRIRVADEGLPPEGAAVAVEEFRNEGGEPPGSRPIGRGA